MKVQKQPLWQMWNQFCREHEAFKRASDSAATSKAAMDEMAMPFRVGKGLDASMMPPHQIEIRDGSLSIYVSKEDWPAMRDLFTSLCEATAPKKGKR